MNDSTMSTFYKSSMIFIKQTVESDIPIILNIQTECYLSSWTTEEYREEIQRKDSLLLSAKKGNKMVGYIMARLLCKAKLSPNEPDVYAELDILNFGVFKKYQRLGIGGLLFENLLDRTAGMSLESIWLEVRESNLDAISFYRKKGFLEVQVRKNFYRQPSENAVVMKLDLSDLP